MKKLIQKLRTGSRQEFPGTISYWEQRYQQGGDSGQGSAGKLAQYKADYLNRFIESNRVQRVIEFGCGDGQQLALLTNNIQAYIGLDVTKGAVEHCLMKFGGDPKKAFLFYSPDALVRPELFLQADLVISLDVIFHLVEDRIYEAYMNNLFNCSTRFVIVYASDHSNNDGNASHVRHRHFSKWIEANRTGWRLIHHERNPFPYFGDSSTGSFADFHVYRNSASAEESRTSR